MFNFFNIYLFCIIYYNTYSYKNSNMALLAGTLSMSFMIFVTIKLVLNFFFYLKSKKLLFISLCFQESRIRNNLLVIKF